MAEDDCTPGTPLTDTDRLTDLERDNARLRDQFAVLEHRVGQLAGEIERLNRRTLPMRRFGDPLNDGGDPLDDTLNGMPPL